jgi:histidine phosphotransferase ChpT
MSVPVTLEALDLAALLCSRVCHDLISPSGAIVNGLEVLEESTDEETKSFAIELIKKSARTASARLQFCRIAFGASGSAAAQIDLGDAENVARGFVEDEKVRLFWNLSRALAPKNRVKLLLNMLLVAAQSIPRGGIVMVEGDGPPEAMTFRILARGLNARVSQAVPGLLAGRTESGTVDAHGIQPFYTGLLARSSGLAVTIETDGDAIIVATRPAASAFAPVTKPAAGTPSVEVTWTERSETLHESFPAIRR